MPNLIFKNPPSAEEKIKQMQESARFDLGDGDEMVCLAPSNNPKRVPKVFLSNDCVFDCAYCGCRRSNANARRYTHTPAEMADIAVKVAKISARGVFITSAIHKNPDYTEELIIETLRIIRNEHRYAGYVHAKIMPGADSRLIREAGFLADRISVNIELPKSEGYKTIAKQKNKKNIIAPMQTIKNMIQEYNAAGYPKRFARSGQTTQMMVGAMRETDKTIITLSEALYKTFNMKRVYYSPFSPVQECDCLPGTSTPDWRARRLYQADMLIKQYDIGAEEILPGDFDLEYDIDPKAAMALNNLGMFPVELNGADYETLIRVPGIGTASAMKILKARREGRVTFEMLKPLGISLKRSVFFFTVNGRYFGGKMLDSPRLRSRMATGPPVDERRFEQLSLY